MQNSDKIILDLCGGTASWSNPYKDAGYDVRVITLPDYDVRKFYGDILMKGHAPTYLGFAGKKPMNIEIGKIHGVLAAPPCTMFSFLRTVAKTPRDLWAGMEIVRACLNIIWGIQEREQDTRHKHTALKFWALENPYYGLMKNFLGRPLFVFDPWEFGDDYGKKTSIWGNFNEPKKTVSEKPEIKIGSMGHTKFDHRKSKDIHPEMFGILTRTERRSITPAGFAKAFFLANP